MVQRKNSFLMLNLEIHYWVTLSNAGACVSITTIERLKKILLEDAVAHAVKLVQGPKPFYIIFNNINIFLRKSEQRLFNKNTMIHATNAAVVVLPDADPIAENLEAKQKRRGKRAAATGADILPMDDDEAKMFSSFVGLTMLLILTYCPGSKEWEGRDVILKAAEDMIASDRPLPPKHTDGRPAGVFDVNEGSKKGIIQMLKKLQEFSGFTESVISVSKTGRTDGRKVGNRKGRKVDGRSRQHHAKTAGVQTNLAARQN
ncbi:hypothetical protein C8R45DRAFT_947340 [Mycena sanguinolenta]|nr:hypothetical protein C8R45DRAFT_947340 [Mycena sanguinolenta]